MSDLLQPKDARKWQRLSEVPPYLETEKDRRIRRLCRDYLTLWERVENETQRANGIVNDWYSMGTDNDKLKAFLSDLLNGDVVFTGPSAEKLRQQAAELLEPKQEIKA